ncbi:Aste57867_17788 [Aphanomyces stellatus]|nr:hypothetical protein As57867_017727 [Aphanomyces stellatus]VFT94532.1 Aste57867_17788 [Aphanomyces stellatus]
MEQTIVLKNVRRADETCTSVWMYWMTINDLESYQPLIRSAIQTADNSFLTPPIVDVESYLGLQDSNGDFVAQIGLLRSILGPYCSIDTYYVAVPPSVVGLYETCQTSLFRAMANDLQGVRSSVDAIPYTLLAPTPASWVGPTTAAIRALFDWQTPTLCPATV